MVKVKICGITNLDDALVAVEYGADALGFVFAHSPRKVTVRAVERIAGKLPPFICKVGVFVDSDLETIKKTMAYCHLDLAQLHGDEDPDYCAALFPRAIKVFTASGLPSANELTRYKAAAYMFDNDKKSTLNGAGQKRLWQLARKAADYGTVILAGGLNPENVNKAIRSARPYAVDVSSGIEAKPGRKDHDRMRAFIAAAKSAGAND